MIEEIAGLGFSHVELSHGVRVSLVPGILKAVEAGMIRVSSCHNFCPLPPGVLHAAPNLYQPTSPDSRELDQWLRHTKRSIDFAHLIGSTILVCHLGSVGFFWFNPAERLRRYMERHPLPDYRADSGFTKLRDQGLRRLRKAAPAHLLRLHDSLNRVLDYAKEKSVFLAFENRENFDELPLDDGFDALFASMPEGAPVGYWHDCGHADLKEKMGLLDHRDHLAKQAHRLIGFHIHDVSLEGRDHQELGSGRIDYGMISAFWRPDHRFVLELSPRLKTEQILSSKQRLERLLSALPQS